MLLIYDWKGNKAPSSIRRKIVQGNIFHPKPNFGGKVRHLFPRFQFRFRCIENVTQASWYDYGKFSYLTKILRNWCSLIKVHVKQLVRSPTSLFYLLYFLFEKYCFAHQCLCLEQGHLDLKRCQSFVTHFRLFVISKKLWKHWSF